MRRRHNHDKRRVMRRTISRLVELVQGLKFKIRHLTATNSNVMAMLYAEQLSNDGLRKNLKYSIQEASDLRKRLNEVRLDQPRLAANHAAAEIFQALTLVPVGEVTLRCERCEPEPGAPMYVFSWRGRIDQKWYAIDRAYSTEQLCHFADVGVDYTRNVGERLREEIRERIHELYRGLKVEGVGL